MFYGLIGLIAFYLLFPIYWALTLALKQPEDSIRTPVRFYAENPSLWAFWGVLKDSAFMHSLLDSSFIALGTTLLSLFFGSLAAYALTKLRFRFRKPMLYLMLAMTTFPSISLLTALFAMFRELRSLDEAISWLSIPTQLVLILLYLIFSLPLAVWILSSYFKSLPDSLLQAARVDGASLFQVYRYIIVPLGVPAFISAGLLIFIACWNEYLFALTFTLQDPKVSTVPVAISIYNALGTPVGLVMAAALIGTLPILLIATVFQKHIVGGLTAGAVKD